MNTIFENFKLHFPYTAEKTVEYEQINDFDIMVTLNDGSRIIFDDLDKSMRNLPKSSQEMTELEFCSEFGKRLRKLMYRAGVTQRELSEMTGISQPNISKYFNGKTIPSFYIADRIAKALGCSTDEFRYI